MSLRFQFVGYNAISRQVIKQLGGSFGSTVEPLLSGHPLLNGQLSKSRNSCRKEWEIKPLLSVCDPFLSIRTRVLPLLPPLLTGHQALDTLKLASFQESDKKNTVRDGS